MDAKKKLVKKATKLINSESVIDGTARFENIARLFLDTFSLLNNITLSQFLKVLQNFGKKN